MVYFYEKKAHLTINKILTLTLLLFISILLILLEIYPIQIIIFYSIALLTLLIIDFGFLSFYSLLFSTFILFYISRYILDIVAGLNVREFDFFYPMIVDDSTFITQNIVLIVFIYSFALSSFLISEKKYLFTNTENKSNINGEILVFLFILSSLFYAGKYYLIYRIIGFNYLYYQSHYVEVMNNIPLIVKLVANLYIISAVALLSTLNIKKPYIIYSFLFLLISSISLLQGGRADFITSFILIIWLYGRKFTTESMTIRKLISLVMIIFLGIFLIQGVSEIRMENDDNHLNIITSLLYEQGTSLIIIPISIMFSGQLSLDMYIEHVVRFFTIPFNGLLNLIGTPFNLNTIIESIAIKINPTAISMGYGLGGSLPAELYLSFGILGMIIALPILMYIYSIFFNTYPCVSNKITLYKITLSAVIIKNIFFVMRGNSLEFIAELIRNSIYILLFVLIYEILNLIHKALVKKNYDNI
ncbi:TPA: O-antigen polysaccharide polymerase Wzy [Morganella morganii subsp. morganii]|nr:O-antigen polysaccharide polymerase Wzy [Morganella morganii subsp. morganii]